MKINERSAIAAGARQFLRQTRQSRPLGLRPPVFDFRAHFYHSAPNGNARFRLQTPGQRPGGPKAISYKFSLGGGFQIRSNDGKPLYEGAFRVDPSTKPSAIDFEHTEGTLKGKAWKGIYALEGDTLMTCDNAPNLDKGRPAAFEAKMGSGHIFITFKRA